MLSGVGGGAKDCRGRFTSRFLRFMLLLISACTHEIRVFCLFQGNFPSLEDMTVAERALHEMRALIRLMQEEVANVREKKKKEQEQEEERRKQAELLAKQEGEKKAAQLAKEKAQRKGDEGEGLAASCICTAGGVVSSLCTKQNILFA